MVSSFMKLIYTATAQRTYVSHSREAPQVSADKFDFSLSSFVSLAGNCSLEASLFPVPVLSFLPHKVHIKLRFSRDKDNSIWDNSILLRGPFLGICKETERKTFRIEGFIPFPISLRNFEGAILKGTLKEDSWGRK